MQKTKCIWVYRPGINGTHWAQTTCKRGFNYLSKIKACDPYVGVADIYNNKSCPICDNPIVIDYELIRKDDIECVVDYEF